MIPTLVAMSLAAAMLPPPAEGSSNGDIAKICRGIEEPSPPLTDEPTPTQASGLRGCDPQNLYYGVKIARNYIRARQCAILQLKTRNGDAVTANRILAQLYANGFGAKVNHRLALSYACRSDPTEAAFLNDVASEGTVTGSSSRAIDFCNDIAGTPAITFCAGLHENAAESLRERRLRGLIEKLPVEAREKYSAMRTAQTAFEDVSSREESGNTGTSASAEDFDGEDRAFQLDDQDTRSFLAGRWSALANNNTADLELNINYRAALIYAARHPDDGVTPNGIQESQRAWLKFRDAFVRFAAAARPGFPRSAVLGHLTEKRALELKNLTETVGPNGLEVP